MHAGSLSLVGMERWLNSDQFKKKESLKRSKIDRFRAFLVLRTKFFRLELKFFRLELNYFRLELNSFRLDLIKFRFESGSLFSAGRGGRPPLPTGGTSRGAAPP